MLDSLKADIVSKYKQTDRAMAPKETVMNGITFSLFNVNTKMTDYLSLSPRELSIQYMVRNLHMTER